MITFSTGDLVRLADSNLQMVLICPESESDEKDDILRQWRCAWEEDGVIITSLVSQCNLVFLSSERRRLVRFKLRFPSCGVFKNAL